MGGKTRIVDQISAIMRARARGRTSYVEPFLGGGSVAATMAPGFSHAYLSDANPDLILLWQALQDGWVPPASITREQWLELKHAAEPSALRAFAGFGASFGGSWFKSYAKNDKENNYARATRKGLLRDIARIGHAAINCHDYSAATDVIDSGSLVYCDPPYAGTFAYRGAGGSFDHDEFWDTARYWSELGAAVFVSEYEAPEDFTAVWRLKVNMTMDSNAANRVKKVEQLFMHTPALERMRS